MKQIKLLSVLFLPICIISCSSTPKASNYTKVMNQPEVQSSGVSDVGEKKLNKAAWNDLEIAHATATRRLKDGSYANSPQDGYLYVRASIVNEGDRPVQAKWRCKFYDSNNIVIGDDENDLPATSSKGLGWHTMLAYPVKSSSHTDEANLVHCIAPSKLATEFRVEVHDTANGVLVYK